MAGTIRGTAAIVSAQCPLALYLHCASHALNLAVVKSLQVTSVCNMIGVVDRVSTFISAHPKRQRALECCSWESTRVSCFQVEGSLPHQMGPAYRCSECFPVPPPLHCGLHGNNLQWRSESMDCWLSYRCSEYTACNLNHWLSQCTRLVFTNSCLRYLQALTSNLQAEARDIVESVTEISNVKAALQDVRNNITSYHSRWFKKIEQMLASIGTKSTPTMWPPMSS